MGNVCQAFLGQAPARQAVLFAGKNVFFSPVNNLIITNL